MRIRFNSPVFGRALFCTFAGLLSACSGAGSPSVPTGTLATANTGKAGAEAYLTSPHKAKKSGSTPISHIIIIFQENRSTDNLFHGLPGADTASYGMNSFGQKVQLTPISLGANYDLNHEHPAFVTEYDSGQMDGFNLVQGGNAYRYVSQRDVQPYFDMAEQYAFGDRMFQSNQGPSFPAHQYIVAGMAAASPATLDNVSSNPTGDANSGGPAGCDAKAGVTVLSIDPVNGVEGNPSFPCYDHPVLTDLLDGSGLSWRYYQEKSGAGLWHYDAVRHVRYGSDYQYVVAPTERVLTDITTGKLSAVSWVTPPSYASDHPGTGTEGPAWVADVVNTLGQSQYWNSTAIVITWDDWGGWYDHVPPGNIFNSYELGFRVPLIIISPYAKKAYVSHVQHEFGSILHFSEEVFGLPFLHDAKTNPTATDERADDLMDCFDFTQRPRAFVTIKAPPFRQKSRPDREF
jgi:phospholipase C